MACAVLRKRVSTDTFDAPPMKRSRSSLTTAPAIDMRRVRSLVSQLSRTDSNPGNTSHINHGQSGTKRKREASPEPPAKRQCLHSTLHEPNTLGDVQPGVSIAEVMDTTPAVFAGATSSNNGATTSNNGATTSNNDVTTANNPTEDIQMEIPKAAADADGEDAAADAQAADSVVDIEGAVGGAAPKESFTEAALAAQFENDFELICEIHPEVDPVYIREQLTLLINDPGRVSTVTFDLYDNVEAPKREQREALEVVQREYERLINMKFDMNEFLQKYPDPLSTFDVREPDVTEIYYDYAEVFLKNEFRSLQVTYIRKTLQKSGFHLTPAYNVLKADNDRAETYRGDTHKRYYNEKYRMYLRSVTYEYPQGRDVIDDDFFWERLFVLNQEEILGHIAAEKEAKQLRLDEARREGRLRECAICVSSEVLLEDMVACQNEHLFCKECVRHSTEELLGQGRASFPCLEAGCGCQYMLTTLEKAVRPETYSLVVRRVQSEEVRLADIEDIATCPFCPYAVVMCDDVSSSVFHCENPVCMEDSCRKCKEVAHPPYSCAEFKLKKEAEFEHFVENQMAEAMIRNCPKCELRFYKEEGCNTMKCTKCGTSMCYVCRTEIKGYNHFRKNPTCQNYHDMSQLHKNEITMAFNEADTKYREQHPELRNTNIVFRSRQEPPRRARCVLQ